MTKLISGSEAFKTATHFHLRLSELSAQIYQSATANRQPTKNGQIQMHIMKPQLRFAKILKDLETDFCSNFTSF